MYGDLDRVIFLNLMVCRNRPGFAPWVFETWLVVKDSEPEVRQNIQCVLQRADSAKAACEETPITRDLNVQNSTSVLLPVGCT